MPHDAPVWIFCPASCSTASSSFSAGCSPEMTTAGAAQSARPARRRRRRRKGPLSPARVAYLKRRRELRDARLAQCSVNDFTRAQWAEIKKQFNYQCAYCLKKTRLTQDHVIPVSKGGGHTASNIVPACRSCNSSKHVKTIEDWFGVAPSGDGATLPDVSTNLALEP